MFPFKTLTELDGMLVGKRVFVRGELNVPVKDGEVENDYRLKKVLPTVEWLRNQGARVFIAGHIDGDEADSLELVYRWFQEHFPLSFITDYIGGDADYRLSTVQNGEVVLLENLRKYSGEKENDKNFARFLASLADIYVNEAFPVSHREHASIVSVPTYLPSYAGFQFEKEYAHLVKAFDPEHPFLFVLGGAKFETKIPLAKKFLKTADYIYLGGAIPNLLWHNRGFNVRDSLIPKEEIDTKEVEESEKVLLPKDVICTKVDGDGVCNPEEMPEESVMRDVGPHAMRELCEVVKRARFVLWNGPLGDYEEGYESSTVRLGYELSKQKDTTVIIGGGDTAAVLLPHFKEEEFTFISTAGGAMLEFLASETLPGIEALRA